MIALYLLLAATAAHQATKEQPVFTMEDFPPEALSRGEQGTVFARLLIDPVGHVDTCSILESTGYPDLDQHTCDLLRTRAKFVPARDESDRPMFSLFRVPVTWAIERAPEVTVNPGFDITINHAPPGVRLPLKIKISYVVTPTGSIANCRQSDTGGPVELVNLACKTAAATPYGIVRDHIGNPVSAMDEISVRFTAIR